MAVGFAALEAAKYAVNSYQGGVAYVPSQRTAMLHQGEAVLNRTQNESFSRVLNKLETKLDTLSGGGGSNYTINATDSKSFESWLRSGGNAILQKQFNNGHLVA